MDVKYLNINSVNEEEGFPYSDVVEVGDMIYISGMVSEDLDTAEEIYGPIEEETRILLECVEKVLEQFGSDMDHVVKVTVVLRNWEDRFGMNEEYKKHFKSDRKPARICFGDVSLSGESKVEMDFIAVKK